MPPKETHEIKMMYAVYEDGTAKPVVIDEIKDLTLEEAEPILEEHNFVKVVRCKDCKYEKTCCRMIRSNGRKPDDFCSYGERKEDAEIH